MLGKEESPWQLKHVGVKGDGGQGSGDDPTQGLFCTSGHRLVQQDLEIALGQKLCEPAPVSLTTRSSWDSRGFQAVPFQVPWSRNETTDCPGHSQDSVPYLIRIYFFNFLLLLFSLSEIQHLPQWVIRSNELIDANHTRDTQVAGRITSLLNLNLLSGCFLPLRLCSQCPQLVAENSAFPIELDQTLSHTGLQVIGKKGPLIINCVSFLPCMFYFK